jgi:hypothetical protein
MKMMEGIGSVDMEVKIKVKTDKGEEVDVTLE